MVLIVFSALPALSLYDILQDMKEARSAIIVMLVLLFIIVGVGVAISRISDKEKAEGVVKTSDERGFLERIFLGEEASDSEEDASDEVVGTNPNGSPSTDGDDDGKMIIINESSDTDAVSGTKGTTTLTLDAPTATVTPAQIKGAAVQPAPEQPASIPSTGSPTVVVLSSLAGMVGGLCLRFGGGRSSSRS